MPDIGTGLDGVRVLVVEDHADSRDLLTELLRFYGAEVMSAENAARAMAIFDRFIPDVLVSNIAMPDVDGCGLLSRVRELAPERGGCVPAIAVTGYVRPADQRRVEAAGFCGFVAKPIDPNLLRASIMRLVRTAAAV